MIEKFKKHTTERYSERFKKIMTDSDYEELCKKYAIIDNYSIKVSKRKFKKCIYYNGNYANIIFSVKAGVITIFPPKKRERKLYESTLEL